MEQKWEGKEHRVFPYGMFRDTWGHFTPKPDLVTPRTREGDLEGWYELMDVIKSNRERITGNQYAMPQ